MLEGLRGTDSPRRLRLYACICLRKIWDLLVQADIHGLLELGERLIEGDGTWENLCAAATAAWRSGMHPSTTGSTSVGPGSLRSHAIVAVYAGIASPSPWDAARTACDGAATVAHLDLATTLIGSQDGNSANGMGLSDSYHAFRREQAHLLRDIFGNPFRPTPTVPSSCLDWADRTVVRIAERAYDQRILPRGDLDNNCLTILADALEDSGCRNSVVLSHLRSGGQHVRGCFVIDSLLSKAS
jgi:hypothetical protein